MEEALRMADDAVMLGVLSVAELVNLPGEINVDLADVKSIMRLPGEALMAIGEARGRKRVLHVVARGPCKCGWHGIQGDAVPGGAGDVGDNRNSPAHQPVEQRGLPHVGAPDNYDRRFAHGVAKDSMARSRYHFSLSKRSSRIAFWAWRRFSAWSNTTD